MKSFDVKQLENDMPGLTRDVSMFINKLQRGDSAYVNVYLHVNPYLRVLLAFELNRNSS